MWLSSKDCSISRTSVGGSSFHLSARRQRCRRVGPTHGPNFCVRSNWRSVLICASVNITTGCSGSTLAAVAASTSAAAAAAASSAAIEASTAAMARSFSSSSVVIGCFLAEAKIAGRVPCSDASCAVLLRALLLPPLFVPAGEAVAERLPVDDAGEAVAVARDGGMAECLVAGRSALSARSRSAKAGKEAAKKVVFFVRCLSPPSSAVPFLTATLVARLAAPSRARTKARLSVLCSKEWSLCEITRSTLVLTRSLPAARNLSWSHLHPSDVALGGFQRREQYSKGSPHHCSNTQNARALPVKAIDPPRRHPAMEPPRASLLEQAFWL